MSEPDFSTFTHISLEPTDATCLPAALEEKSEDHNSQRNKSIKTILCQSIKEMLRCFTKIKMNSDLRVHWRENQGITRVN